MSEAAHAGGAYRFMKGLVSGIRHSCQTVGFRLDAQQGQLYQPDMEVLTTLPLQQLE